MAKKKKEQTNIPGILKMKEGGPETQQTKTPNLEM